MVEQQSLTDRGVLRNNAVYNTYQDHRISFQKCIIMTQRDAPQWKTGGYKGISDTIVTLPQQMWISGVKSLTRS
jgi:hypothetical protein